MDAQTKVSRAVTRLVVRHPFFGSMALSVRVEQDDDIGTMCTDGTFIKWNKEFVDGMTDEETVGVMAHEVCHIVMKHQIRRGERDPERWNIACDYAINEILVEGQFTLPEGGLLDGQYNGLTAEQIYERLPEDIGKGGGGGFGEVIDATKNGKQLSDAEVKQMEADIDSKVMMAAAAAKSVGKLPAKIKGLIDKMKRSQVDWRDVMRRFIGGDQPDDYSMRKPQRKMYHMNGIVAPSVQKIGAGDVVIAMDTSGSVSSHELSFFLGEANSISQDIKPSSITVITCDAEIQTVRRYEQGEEVEMVELSGRGGTLVSPVFEYIETHQLNVDNMVYLSDMCVFDFPEQPHYPVLWVSSWADAAPAPWGETTYIQT
jgi:predicted metal-dependent peptidase